MKRHIFNIERYLSLCLAKVVGRIRARGTFAFREAKKASAIVALLLAISFLFAFTWNENKNNAVALLSYGEGPGAVLSLPKGESPCLDDLRSIYHAMSLEQSLPNTGKISYLSYSVRTVMADSAQQPPVETHIELWMQDKLIEIKSSMMEVYQDEKETFVVMPSKKMILRSDALTNKKAENHRQQQLMLHDSLFNYSNVLSCNSIKTSQGIEKTLSLSFIGKGREITGISKALFRFSTAGKQVHSVRFYYAEESELFQNNNIVYVDYIFKKTESDHKGKKLSSRVASRFMKGKKLNQTYQDYKLVDSRKRVSDKEFENKMK